MAGPKSICQQERVKEYCGCYAGAQGRCCEESEEQLRRGQTKYLDDVSELIVASCSCGKRRSGII